MIKALLKIRKNKSFYEKFKRAIWIRRTYPELFRVFPPDIRNTNIERVECEEGILSYARVSDDRIAIVVANTSTEDRKTTVKFQWENKPCAKWKAKDLMSGKSYSVRSENGVLQIDGVMVNQEDVGLILLESR